MSNCPLQSKQEPHRSCVQHACVVVSFRSLLNCFSPAGKLVHDFASLASTSRHITFTTMCCGAQAARQAAGAGKLTHHITQEQVKGQPAHSQVHDSPVPGSQCCLLHVLDVSPIQVVHEVAAEWGPVAYEALLELHTGRTHQVSAGQLPLLWCHMCRATTELQIIVPDPCRL